MRMACDGGGKALPRSAPRLCQDFARHRAIGMFGRVRWRHRRWRRPLWWLPRALPCWRSCSPWRRRAGRGAAIRQPVPVHAPGLSAPAARGRVLRRVLRWLGSPADTAPSRRAPGAAPRRLLARATAAQAVQASPIPTSRSPTSWSWAAAWRTGSRMAWRMHSRTRPTWRSCARMSRIPACCATNTRAISTGGTWRAKTLRSRRRISW